MAEIPSSNPGEPNLIYFGSWMYGFVNDFGLTEGYVEFQDDLERDRLERFCAEMMLGIEDCMDGGSVLRAGKNGQCTATSGVPSIGNRPKDEFHEASFANSRYVFSDGEKELFTRVEFFPEYKAKPNSVGAYTETRIINVTGEELRRNLYELSEDILRPTYSDRFPEVDSTHFEATI